MYVEVKNLLCFDDLKFNYDNYGVTSISGHNGSGKTSFVELLPIILYGKYSKGISKEGFIRSGCEYAYGKLVVNNDADEIIIERKFTPKEILDIFVNGKNVSGKSILDTQKTINNIFGDYSFFKATTLYSQEGFEPFISAPDSEKKGVLETILQYEVYNKAKEFVDKKLSMLSKEIDELNKNIVYIEGGISTTKEQLEKLNTELEEETKRAKKNKEDITARINVLLESKIDIQSVNNQIRDLKLNKDNDLKELQDKFNNEIEEYNKQLEIINSRIEKLKFFTCDYDNTERKLISKKESLKELIELKQSPTICPTCGQELPKEQIDKKLKEIDISIKKITGEIKELEEYKEFISQALNTMKEIEEVKNKYNIDIQNIKDKFYSKREEIESYYRSKLDELHNIIYESSVVDSEISRLKSLLVDSTKQIKTTISSLEKSLQEKVVNLEENKLKLDNLQRDFQLYSFWSIGFGNSGIKSLLLDKYCQFITDNINYYLKNISDNLFYADFNTTSTTKKGDIRDKIQLGITYKGDTVDYKELSGGQKTIINLAIMLALRKLASLKHKVLPMIFFDEVFSSLDTDYSIKVAEILKTITDMTVFIVTHNEAMKDMADRTIVFEYSPVDKVSSISIM